ncbi:cytochrome P450 [Actinospongicola halichondriae]|uniref:cytochrome P450 n=1 Tax=Actinospongicola halichondriae TaxID=3236844 RepID=UPI003D50E344
MSILDGVDLSDPEFWTRPWAERDAVFDAMRAEEPIKFFEEPDLGVLPQGPGYWALTRHADVVEASRKANLFCSGRGGSNIGDVPDEMLEFLGSIINMDDPRHAKQRKIVARGFTPRVLENLKHDVERAAVEIVDEIAEKGECDFVTDVAALLPLRIILDLLGIPRSEEKFIFDRTNIILGLGDEEYVPNQDPMAVMGTLFQAGQDLTGMVAELGAERRKNPGDDIISLLVNAQDEGDGVLTDEELGSFFVLLVVAGNETTRNAIAHGLHWMTQNPEQKDWWWEDFDARAPQAVEEIVRYASPVMHFRRTCTTDGTMLGGREFSEGEKVVLWYGAANRDPAVFEDPHRFDLSRPLETIKDHVGFGGPGPHFCLGAHLARREITLMFRELQQRIPDIHAVGEPDRLKSNFINGIKHMKAEFTPSK